MQPMTNTRIGPWLANTRKVCIFVIAITAGCVFGN